jgi:hypothetical protein
MRESAHSATMRHFTDPTTFQQKRMHMHPYICKMLAQCDAWFVPRARKEPVTLDMFNALAKFLHSQKDGTTTFLSQEFAVFD